MINELVSTSFAPYSAIDFAEVQKQARTLADSIESQHDKLIDILLGYETFEVAEDETARTLDLLRHLDENEQYFKFRTGAVASFLPRNQPLYAFTCFVIVPSLMASEVYFRIPHTTKHFFPDVLSLLNISDIFPNVIVSSQERLEFLEERSSVSENPKNGETRPVTDVVIFTGTFANAGKLRMVFDKRTLFIANDAGHNPVVISKEADLNKAVEAVTTLQFYNQGQDCAAPNSILVQENVADKFLEKLRQKVKDTKVGEYQDKSCRVGPISDPEDLVRIQKFFIEQRKFIDSATSGIINARNSLVYPTVICKPLSNGGNFEEIFAPVLFVQVYKDDDDLKNYFEDKRYAQNAMYVTLYGSSAYVESLIDKPVGGKILHDRSTFIHNTHLHAPGIERGTQPYGGYGYGASSLSINGKVIALPTLPQRDMYEWFIKPLLDDGTLQQYDPSVYTQTIRRNVSKLLKLKLPPVVAPKEENFSMGDEVYIDLEQFKNSISRYAKVSANKLYPLLEKPNTSYIATLENYQLVHFSKLLNLLKERAQLSFKEFETKLFAIPKEKEADNNQNRVLQRGFFHSIYQLLFGRNDGPRLAEFLWSLEEEKIDKLIGSLTETQANK